MIFNYLYNKASNNVKQGEKSAVVPDVAPAPDSHCSVASILSSQGRPSSDGYSVVEVQGKAFHYSIATKKGQNETRLAIFSNSPGFGTNGPVTIMG